MTEVALNDAHEKKLRDLALLVYALQGIGLLIGVTWIVAVAITYLKIGEARNTWLESHYNWQLRTFWYGLAAMIVAWILMLVKIGFLLAMAVTVWAIYRIVKGWLALNDRKPISSGFI